MRLGPVLEPFDCKTADEVTIKIAADYISGCVHPVLVRASHRLNDHECLTSS